MNYKLPDTLREQIVSYLRVISVPSEVGANLMSICKALSELEQVKSDISKANPESSLSEGEVH